MAAKAPNTQSPNTRTRRIEEGRARFHELRRLRAARASARTADTSEGVEDSDAESHSAQSADTDIGGADVASEGGEAIAEIEDDDGDASCDTASDADGPNAAEVVDSEIDGSGRNGEAWVGGESEDLWRRFESEYEEELTRLRESLAQQQAMETSLLQKLQTKRRRVAAAEKSLEV